MKKHYPDSKVELTPLIAKYYDIILDFMTFGIYDKFIYNVIKDCNFKPNEKILDLVAGTGKNAFIMMKFIGKNADITAVDISQEMQEQFEKRFAEYKNVKFMKTRIDKPLEFDEKFDDVFISFVLHGFPHDVRETIIKNAYNSLKSEGRFLIVDFAEFSLEKMPIYYRIPFQTIECKFAFDFIKRDWKQILSEFGFGKFSEKHYFKNYVRLLEAIKIG